MKDILKHNKYCLYFYFLLSFSILVQALTSGLLETAPEFFFFLVVYILVGVYAEYSNYSVMETMAGVLDDKETNKG